MTKKMLAAGECVYCHTALQRPTVVPPPPGAVHVTKIELHGAGAGRVFDSVTARLAGCFSGCLSAAITVMTTAMILGFVAWQLYVQSRNVHPPAPAPAPSGDHPRRRR